MKSHSVRREQSGFLLVAIPANLQKNIEFKFYESGHMVYAHEASLKSLHSSVAAFILATQN
ncbi:MAG: hypothetical protein WCB11_12140 [Terriglobales bacterium]